MDFFFEFASLLLIMLLGHWIEMKAIGEAGDGTSSITKLVPKDAHVVLGRRIQLKHDQLLTYR